MVNLIPASWLSFVMGSGGGERAPEGPDVVPSRMRTLGQDFCRVCSDVILRRLRSYSRVNLRFAWKGVGSDQRHYTGWGGDDDQHPVRDHAGPFQHGTSTGPALIRGHTGPFMAWKGERGDQGIYYSQQRHIDEVTWDLATAGAVPNVGTNTGASLSAGPDRLFLAWRGIEGDPSLYSTTFDGSDWARQHNYFGTGSSAVPSVLAMWS